MGLINQLDSRADEGARELWNNSRASLVFSPEMRKATVALIIPLLVILAPLGFTGLTPISPAEAQRTALPDFAGVAETVSPSVVSLRVAAKRPVMGFFGMMGEQVQRGAGSGVIIRSNGYILTNNHVIDGASTIEVRLHDNRRFEGEVVGRDPSTDLAVVKINATGLRAAKFADMSKVKPGQWVVAIGSPYGLDYTVTTGVVSALGRGGFGMTEIEDFVQTDASINPGNSGGPLVDLDGNIVGINTMIHGRATGIGFAAPADLAKRVADQLISNGSVRRAFIGVMLQELTPALAKELKIKDNRGGAIVADVVSGSPAEKAGLKEGDVIIQIDGTRVSDGRDVVRAILQKGVGAEASVKIMRDGRERTVKLVTTERPDRESARAGASSDQRSALGMSLAPAPEALTRRYGLKRGVGLYVESVSQGSKAAEAGLSRGDLIVEADRQPVRSEADLEKAMRDGRALLRVLRQNGAFYTLLER